MKKKFLSAMLLGLVALGISTTFVSCKDYDDDISAIKSDVSDLTTKLTNLQTQLSEQKTDLEQKINDAKTALNDAISKKADDSVVSDLAGKVETLEGEYGGVLASLNNVKSALGSDTDIQTLVVKYGSLTGAINTLNTGLSEEQLTREAAIDNLQTQINAITGMDGSLTELIEKLKDYPEVKSKVEQNKTDIENLQEKVRTLEGSLTDVKTDMQNLSDNIDLVQSSVNVLQVCVDRALRSLVFMPHLYLDGIEAYQYKYLSDKSMTNTPNLETTNRQGKTVKGLDNWDLHEAYVYGPVWGINYHMNPACSNVQYSDVQGFNVLNPDAMYYYTSRSGSVNGLEVTSPEKNAGDVTVFNAADGIVTAGIQLSSPSLVSNYPTARSNQKIYTAALQVNAKKVSSSTTDKTTITSDYAMLVATKVRVDGLIWYKAPMYKGIARDAAGETNPTGDENGSICTEKIHVWDTPQEALQDRRGAALELYYQNRQGINLIDYLGVDIQEEVLNQNGVETWGSVAKWQANDANHKTYGLTYEFKLVDYSVDGNTTHDSRYATISSDGKGTVIAQNVKEDGAQYEDESATSVDREPLVQVLVKRGGTVIRDGYILIHITKQPVEQPHTNTCVTEYPTQSKELGQCSDAVIFETTWSQFSQYVLTQHMNNMEKETFDRQYVVDCNGSLETVDPLTQEKVLAPYVYVKNGNDTIKEAQPLGTIAYKQETYGTTNHVWTWTLNQGEVEKITHHMTAADTTITRFFAYVGLKANGAKYDTIFIQMNAKLSRKAVNVTKFDTKNNNYWYGFDGTMGDKKEVAVFDVKEPTDGGDIKAISRTIPSTLVGNKLATLNGHEYKFYFAPETDYETIKGMDGVTYTITAASDVMYCPLTNSVCTYKYDKDKLATYLQKCAILYGDTKQDVGTQYTGKTAGVFDNKELIAKGSDGSSTTIATLNQKTGEISLLNNSRTDAILNAVGWVADHKNITDEFTAWVGVIAMDQCDLAIPVTDGVNLVSWQRPINVDPMVEDQFVDAKTNGNKLYIVDLLNLYDWRGPTNGAMNMFTSNSWFWSYYGIREIDIDLNPNNVLTDMHYTAGDVTHKLADITTAAKLIGLDGVAHEQQYKFDISKYNYAGEATNLNSYVQKWKENFGTIIYYNNGDNVEKFTVKIPVTIVYEWGKFSTTITITINRTLQ